MKSTKQDRQSDEFWARHVSQSENFKGSIKDYCLQEGLATQTFYRWRGRLKKRSSPIKKTLSKNSFVPVRINPIAEPLVIRGQGRALPDPKWVAELIFHLQGGLN